MSKQTYTQQRIDLTIIGRKESIKDIENKGCRHTCDDAIDVPYHKPTCLCFSENPRMIIYKREGYGIFQMYNNGDNAKNIEEFGTTDAYQLLRVASIGLTDSRRRNERILHEMAKQLMGKCVLYKITFDFEPFIMNGKLIRMSAKFEQKGNKIKPTFTYDVEN